MIEIAVVEDEKQAAETIKEFLARYAKQYNFEINVTHFESAEAFLQNYSEACEVVFMDIELPGMDGMTAVRKLRERNKDVLVMFVTNLAQYAVNGYEVQAFDFIIKPVVFSDFSMKLRRLFECLATVRKREIWVVTRHGEKFIPAGNIKYVEVMRHQITYHMTYGDIVGSGTLKAVREQLEGLPFVLCNRCYLVNLQFVTEVIYDTVYIGDEPLQISSSKRKDFLSALNNYLGFGGKLK